MGDAERWHNECLRKKRYRTLEYAEDIAKKIKNDPKKGTELFVYACPRCLGFHLTKRKEYGHRREVLDVVRKGF